MAGTISRKENDPATCKKEMKWFQGKFITPKGVDNSGICDLTDFQSLIWNNPGDLFIEKYGASVADLVSLLNGWLDYGPIKFLLNIINRSSLNNNSFCMLLPCITNDVQEKGRMCERMIFVANVGKNDDGSVFLGTPERGGKHWVLITVERKEQLCILYCDSLGWDVPTELIECLNNVTQRHGFPCLDGATICVMHPSSASSSSHVCTDQCKNYPFQTCGNVCGIVAVVGAVIAACDDDLFLHLTGPRTQEDIKYFLLEPTKYERYLRRILISWFMKEEISLIGLSQSYILSQKVVLMHSDHMYFDSRQKRKRLSSCQSQVGVATDLCQSQVGVATDLCQSQVGVATDLCQSQVGVATDLCQSQVGVATDLCQSQVEAVTDLTQSQVEAVTDLSQSQVEAVTDLCQSQVGVATDLSQSQIDRATDLCQSRVGVATDLCQTQVEEVTDLCQSQVEEVTGLCQEKEIRPGKTSASRQCPYCNQTFTHRQTLYKHKQRKHSSELLLSSELSAVDNTFSHCDICGTFKSSKIRELIKHYNSVHHQNIQISRKLFSNEKEFQEWKKQVEKESSSYFFQNSGTKKSQIYQKVVYYYCNRTGEQKLRTDRKRSLKSQGSCKINNKCPAHMIARQNSLDGSVVVEYCLHHIGHSCKLGHLYISDELRSHIAGKLNQGVDVGTVLNEIRNKVTEIDRDTLLTRRDIHNIRNQFNISQIRKAAEDGQSVHLWVQELKDKTDNPIIYYKAQGSIHDFLNEDDFLLGIQTDFQRAMLLEHGSKIVCVDSTHDTTQYKFSLTTIVVLDDFDEGIPVAWALSNREDSEILQEFFGAVRKVCKKPLQTKIFMSDLANNFYNAWCITFPKPLQRLYCSWHVDKSWRSKICSKFIPSEKDQCIIYTLLKDLQSETDEFQFRQNLQDFLIYLKNISRPFFEYFKQHYVLNDKIYLWAACFRIGSLANTNMFIEAFHRVLKDVYLDKKQNRRIDNLLVVLLKISRDKAFEQLIKTEKGKVTHHNREIKQRHKAAQNVNNIQHGANENEWLVTSSEDDKKTYVVKKLNDDAQSHSCKLYCDFCFVCVHLYTCTCPDSLIRPFPCKHTHAVQMFENRSVTQPLPDREGMDEDLDFFRTVLCKDKPEDSKELEKVQAACLAKQAELQELYMNTKSLDVARAIFGRLQEAYVIGLGMQRTRECDKVTEFTKAKKFPSNKHFETQQRFFSTKKQSKPSKLKLRRPDLLQQVKVSGGMPNQITPSRCAFCFQEDDKSGSIVTCWFKCTKCALTLHVACALSVGNDGQDDTLICSLCKSKEAAVL